MRWIQQQDGTHEPVFFFSPEDFGAHLLWESLAWEIRLHIEAWPLDRLESYAGDIERMAESAVHELTAQADRRRAGYI
jgi:hypothetical protein